MSFRTAESLKHFNMLSMASLWSVIILSFTVISPLSLFTLITAPLSPILSAAAFAIIVLDASSYN